MVNFVFGDVFRVRVKHAVGVTFQVFELAVGVADLVLKLLHVVEEAAHLGDFVLMLAKLRLVGCERLLLFAEFVHELLESLADHFAHLSHLDELVLHELHLRYSGSSRQFLVFLLRPESRIELCKVQVTFLSLLKLELFVGLDLVIHPAALFQNRLRTGRVTHFRNNLRTMKARTAIASAEDSTFTETPACVPTHHRV